MNAIGGKGEKDIRVCYKKLSFGEILIDPKSDRISVRSPKSPSTLNSIEKRELIDELMSLTILRSVNRYKPDFLDRLSHGFSNFLLDMFLSKSDADDFRLNLDEQYQVWLQRHGVPKSLFLVKWSIFCLLGKTFIGKLDWTLTFFERVRKFL